MKGLVVCLALGVLAAVGGSRKPPVLLYTDFQQTPPDDVLESIQEELDEIMEPIGIELGWRSLAASRGTEVSVELAVIRFKGRCDTDDMEPVEGYPGPLGWTHITDGEILPFSGINCDGVRILLQRDLLKLPPQERPSAYGRALARVLAHELYHIFAKTTKHGSSGVAKPAYSVHELLCNKFQFEKREFDLLRAHHLRMFGASAGQ